MGVFNGFFMPSHLPPYTGQATDLQKQEIPHGCTVRRQWNCRTGSWLACSAVLPAAGRPLLSHQMPLLSLLTVGRQWIGSRVGAERDWVHTTVQLREMTSARKRGRRM